MRVLLVNVPFRRIVYNFSGTHPMAPLGVAYIAAVLEGQGHEPVILDLPAHPRPRSREEVARLVLDGGFGLVGLSTTLFSLKEAGDLAAAIKAAAPGVPVLAGGPGTASFSPEALLRRLPALDLLIHGEGEGTTLELVRALERGGQDGPLPGMSRLGEDGQVVRGPEPPLPDLGDLPLPARHLLPMDRYSMHPPFGLHPPVAAVETARGCPCGCAFCSLPGGHRQRQVEGVVEELRILRRDYAVGEVHFVDPTFPLDRERTLELCEALIRADLGLAWSCKSRTDCVDDEVLELMGRAGCYIISYGLESGAEQMLQALGKGVDPGRHQQALARTRAHGIRSRAYIMFGAPGETEASVAATLDLVKGARPDFALFAELLPDPGSRTTARMIEQGNLTADDVEAFYLGDPPPALLERTVTGLPREQVAEWLARAYREFYGRPSYLLRRLAGLRNPRELAVMTRGVLAMVKERLTDGPVHS